MQLQASAQTESFGSWSGALESTCPSKTPQQTRTDSRWSTFGGIAPPCNPRSTKWWQSYGDISAGVLPVSKLSWACHLLNGFEASQVKREGSSFCGGNMFCPSVSLEMLGGWSLSGGPFFTLSIPAPEAHLNLLLRIWHQLFLWRPRF